MVRSVKYGLYGAVLAGLVVTPLAWQKVDKSVQLVVDGKSQTVQTTAANVGQVLRSQGYRVTAHDLVAPAASAHVKDGGRIVLRRGRLLHLNVDGRRTDVWTTAPTVAAALNQLGYSTTDFVSVSRSRRLPLGATDIAIRTPMQVAVVHDGKREQVMTTDTTVGQLLSELGVTVGADDRLSAAPSSALRAGELVRLQRVTTKPVVRIQTVPFPTTRRKDNTLAKGHTRVITTGRSGKVKVTYSVVYVDGKAVGQTKLSAVTLAKPRAQVVKVGTKVPKVTTLDASSGSSVGSVPAPSPSSAKAFAKQLMAKRGWGADQYSCLVTLWNHESGWRVHAANPSGAYGIPQALPGSKMGPGWQDSAEVQIRWGLRYIASRYDTPCGAWNYWQNHNYY